MAVFDDGMGIFAANIDDIGPLLFSLYINDISDIIESEIRLFADDCVCYREIRKEDDTLKLQRDIDRLGSCARKWGTRFQPVKCK